MVADRFSNLMNELGKALQMTLSLDPGKGCCITFKDQLVLYLQQDHLGENLQLVFELGVLQPGPYREKVLQEALKANGLPSPRRGIFAFGGKTNCLLLQDQQPLDSLNLPQLLDILKKLITIARAWKNAIAHAEEPSYRMAEISSATASTKGSGMFGL